MYRFPILLDWLVSIAIDYDRILSSIENIDSLRPAIRTLSHQYCITFIILIMSGTSSAVASRTSQFAILDQPQITPLIRRKLLYKCSKH